MNEFSNDDLVFDEEKRKFLAEEMARYNEEEINSVRALGIGIIFFALIIVIAIIVMAIVINTSPP